MARDLLERLRRRTEGVDEHLDSGGIEMTGSNVNAPSPTGQLPPTPLESLLRDNRLTADRDAGWSRGPCDLEREWHGEHDRIRSHRRLFMGPQAVADPDAKRRWVERTSWPCPPGELARTYLRGCLAQHSVNRGRCRVPFRREALRLLNIPPPYFFDPSGGRDGPWAYVDISGAYWSLLRTATLDMDFRLDLAQQSFRCGHGAVEFGDADELVTKRVRVATVGVARARDVRMFQFGVPMAFRSRADVFAPDAVGTVMTMMHAIALEAIQRFGAAMWMVDAAIIRPHLVSDYLDWLDRDWGLVARADAVGPGHLWCVGAYKVGERVTLTAPYAKDGRAVSNLLGLSPSMRSHLTGCRQWLLGRSRSSSAWSPALDVHPSTRRPSRAVVTLPAMPKGFFE